MRYVRRCFWIIDQRQDGKGNRMSDTSPLALNSGLTGNVVSGTGFGGPSPLGPQSPLDTYTHKMEDLGKKGEAEEKRYEAEVNPMRERLERSLQGGVGAP